jgi:hypothetical protein
MKLWRSPISMLSCLSRETDRQVCVSLSAERGIKRDHTPTYPAAVRSMSNQPEAGS